MVDIVDRATRSRMMSGIRGRDTKPELIVRSYLHRAGLRFRLGVKLPGKPDLVLPRHKTAVFVNGCFWHRHEGCRYATTPTSNADFWRKKFASNVRRDALVKQQIEGLGWRMQVIWGCQLSELELGKLVTRIRMDGAGEGKNGEG